MVGVEDVVFWVGGFCGWIGVGVFCDDGGVYGVGCEGIGKLFCGGGVLVCGDCGDWCDCVVEEFVVGGDVCGGVWVCGGVVFV